MSTSNAQSVAASSNIGSDLQVGKPVQFILSRRYTLTHRFSDEQYKHLALLGPPFEEALFSRPPGPDNEVFQFLVDLLADFWVRWPIKDSKGEKTIQSKEIVSMFVMALERRWSDPALRPEGDAGTPERMLDLMWFLHELIDEMFPEQAEEDPDVGEDLSSFPELVEIQWM